MVGLGIDEQRGSWIRGDFLGGEGKLAKGVRRELVWVRSLLCPQRWGPPVTQLRVHSVVNVQHAFVPVGIPLNRDLRFFQIDITKY